MSGPQPPGASGGAGLQPDGLGGQRPRRPPQPPGEVRRGQLPPDEPGRGHQIQCQPEVHHRRSLRRAVPDHLPEGGGPYSGLS